MGRLRFAATPGALIDLLALLPLLFFFASWDLALFPVLRMIRMLRLVRHLNALAQPDRFSSIPTSMYWAVMTVGRVMTMILAVGSLGMVALPAGIIATAFSEQLRQTKMQKRARDGTTAGADATRDPLDRVKVKPVLN